MSYVETYWYIPDDILYSFEIEAGPASAACIPLLDSAFYITYNSTRKFMSMADFV